MRRLADLGPVALASVAGPEAVTAAFEEFLALEAAARELQAVRHALDPVLAPHAGGYLRQGAKPGRSDGLSALLAQTVLAAAEPLQRLGQLIGASDEQAAGGKAHLAVLVLADDVDFISQGGIVPDRSRELLKNHGTAHLADPIHRVIQF
jgi:hypothetical protein